HPPKWTGYQLLALIFGTLLSSQGTDASFVLTSVTLTGAFLRAFVLAFPTLSESVPLAFQVLRFRGFPFPAIPTLSEVFHRISRLQFPD
ncbi:hypothetical protein AB0B01_30475, partial [Streptomyces sp. NPDC044571]|uniref:hypothetical protein n=1 Tax=Streptomyces sp. NPDC044571 TaxID=3155371 RepID=UPI0033F64086